MRSPRQLLAWAGACAAAFVAVLAVAYFLPAAGHADRAAVRDFAALNRPAVHAVAHGFAMLCNWYLYLVLVAAALWVTLRTRGARVAAAAGLLVLGATASSQALKELLAYPRLNPATHHLMSVAYPSGHATAAMALAAAVVLAAPRERRTLAAAGGALFTLAVSFSILILAWHFVSDVIGAYLLSTAWSLVVVAGYRAAGVRWPAAGGMRSTVHRAVADWRFAAGAAVVACLLALAIAVTRIGEVVNYARAHTSFVVAITAVAASAAVLLAGVAAVSSRHR